jgi:hydrogenase assembly chaperone HypC/HupF
VSADSDQAVDPAPGAHCDPAGECITCGDVAIPMRVVRIDQGRDLALCCDHEGHRSTVETALVDQVAAGDEVLVHAGTAIAKLDQEALSA